MYDAKYQILVDLSEHEDQQNHPPTLTTQTLSSLQSASDLIPGVYEGGFKTWECSLDLASYLDRSTFESLRSRFPNPHHSSDPDYHQPKPFTILELGCGTAVPTVSLCFRLFDHLLKQHQPLRVDHLQPSIDDQVRGPSQPKPPVLEIILQDFNSDVLRLLTFPNILLAFHRALLVNDQYSSSTRNYEGDQDRQSNRSEVGSVELKSEDDLEITEDLKTRFSEFVDSHRIRFTLVSGSWSTFDLKSILSNPMASCDLIISSETLYSTESIPDLIKILMDSRIGPGGGLHSEEELEGGVTEILIASKSVYFGVGGGTNAFIKAVEELDGAVEFVDLNESTLQPADPITRSISKGVSRVLMRVKLRP